MNTVIEIDKGCIGCPCSDWTENEKTGLGNTCNILNVELGGVRWQDVHKDCPMVTGWNIELKLKW